MSTVRYGIIGCGNIYKTHADGLKGVEGAELVAVFDTDADRAKAAAELYSVQQASSLGEMFGLVDAVIICLPSGLHSDITLAAANAGKHVLTEKPLDITLANAIRMVAGCEAAGVHLGCISQHRFARDMAGLQQKVANGELGRVFQGDAIIKWFRSQSYYDSAGWRGTFAMDGGGCLMNQGVHYIDMIQWIMGGVKSVQARTFTLTHNIEVEDTAMAIVEYHNGAVGLIQGSTSCYPSFAERLEIHGTDGSAVLESDRLKIWKTKPQAEQEPFGSGINLMRSFELDPDPTTANWAECHRLQIEDFTRAITEGRPPAITGRAALEPLKIILAIYESSRQGGARVELSSLQG